MRQNWQLWSGDLSDNQLKLINEKADKLPDINATIFSDSKVNTDVRRSKVKWLSHDNDVRGLLWGYVEEANRNAFGFDVTSVGDIQYTEYHATESGHYDWHHDIHWNGDKAYDRKLSVTVQLSGPEDYTGGGFEFNETQTPDYDLSTKKGTVLVFPSYLQHRVKPVESGTRVSLVAWFEGPRWK
tara:strand:- start:984 stop:1535 length:552 start_codon:yes stop_codon:yes gene_type:complete